MCKQHLFQAKWLCLHSFPLLLHTFFCVGCFPQSVLRKQIMVDAQVWQHSKDQRWNVMEGWFFFFFFKTHHALWHIVSELRKRNSAFWLIWQSRAAAAAAAAIRSGRTWKQWSFFFPHPKKAEKTFTSQIRQKEDSHAVKAALLLGLRAGDECI